MPKRARWALKLSTSLLFLAGYLALASVQAYGTPLLLAAVIVVFLQPFAERLDAASGGYRLITKAVSIAYFCFIPLSIFGFGLLNAVIALIIFIQFYTMLHKKDEKSYYHIFLMSFFQLLAACTQAPEASIGFVLALFLGATIWSFFSLRVAYESEESQMRVPADIVRFGEEPTKQIHDGRDPFDMGIVGYVFSVIVMAVAITIGIFFSTPRIEAGVLGRSNGAFLATGLPDRVHLVSGQTLQQDFTPVLRAEFPDDPDGRALVPEMYWRVTTLPKFDGGSWDFARLDDFGDQELQYHGRTSWHVDNGEIERARRDDAKVEHQIVYMDDVPVVGMPALDLVQRITIPNSQRVVKVSWSDMHDLSAVLKVDGPRQIRYEAWSEIYDPTPEELRSDTGPYDKLSDEDHQILTEQTLLPETIALVQRTTEGAANTFDKVAALTRFLSGREFTYSLNVPQLPADNAIDAFINTVRVGHCELYATALALMVRSLDIPARVVNGYKGGEFNESDKSYLIRRSMAHLWVEVLFPKHGWVKFDPSPHADPNEGPGFFARISMAASLYALKARMMWYSNVIGYQGRRVADLNDLRLKLFGEYQALQAKVGDVVVSGQLSQFFVVGAVGAGMLILFGWAVFRAVSDAAALRRSPLGHYVLSRDQRRAISLYRGLRHKLRRLGIDPLGKTAEELLDEVAGSDWPQKAEAQSLLTAYNEARFGGRALPGARLAQLMRSLRALKVQRHRP